MSAPEPEKPHVVTRHRGLVRRTALVSSLTLLSRLLGFGREILMALLFGDRSVVSDAFFTAWRVPNLFRRLLGEGALSTSLQATLTEVDAGPGDEAGRRLFLRTLSLAFGMLMAVSLAAMVAVAWMPATLPGTGWSLLGHDAEMLRDLTLRLLPYVVLVCLTALAGGALQVRGHYLVPSLAPAVMNLAWIGALVALGFAFGWGTEPVLGRQWSMARWLAWAVLAGGVLQLLLHVPPMLRRGLLVAPAGAAPAGEGEGDVAGRGPADVLRGAAPLALAAAVYQINVMIDGLMAWHLLEEGGPTALYYANRIQQFPLALVALAATTSVFPSLKAHGHLRQLGPLRRLHDSAQLGVLFLALPAAAGLVALAHPISSVLFEHGNYGAEGVARMTAALRVLAIALVPAGAAGLVGRTYIALDDPHTPVRTSIWMMLANIVLNWCFVRVLGMDVEGLALATAITIWGNLLWLLAGMRRRLGLPAGVPGRGVRVLRLCVATLATALGAWLAARGLAPWIASESLALRGGGLALAIAAGGAAFGASAAALGLDEWRDLRARLGERLGRRGP